jgi:hypothetical protein
MAGNAREPRQPMDWDRITAVSALLVSVATVVFLGYQTLLMRTQVEASIWPYVQVGTSCCGQGFRVLVENKGVGPAIIKYTVVKVDGQPQTTWRGAMTKLLGTDPGPFNLDTLSHRVMAPNDNFAAFEIAPPDISFKIVQEARKARLSGEICYCSLLDACWLASTTSARLGERRSCAETPPAIQFKD